MMITVKHHNYMAVMHLSMWILGEGQMLTQGILINKMCLCQNHHTVMNFTVRIPQWSIFIPFAISEWCQDVVGKNCCCQKSLYGQMDTCQKPGGNLKVPPRIHFDRCTKNASKHVHANRSTHRDYYNILSFISSIHWHGVWIFENVLFSKLFIVITFDSFGLTNAYLIWTWNDHLTTGQAIPNLGTHQFLISTLIIADRESNFHHGRYKKSKVICGDIAIPVM